ncbi:LOW QUALITY PROTEIN: kinectin [Drosophila ficusphila]|uniref:LOW QUALITY PROTEIN: kinectin n=1 Tax=Drosophila ficusphila TaxID=30025 RepID=UPI0007E73FCA|nr:LOW QUALITY PROTEIN: kinectin [Drosophila ficusphila]
MSSRRSGFVLDAKSMGLDPSRPPSPSPPTQLPAFKQNCVETQQSDMNTKQLEREESSIEASGHAQCNSSMESMSTDYYRCLIKKLRDDTGDAADVNFELNNIFLKRLDEIDCLDGQSGDAMYTSQLRLVTYQEWVDFLLNVNSVILGNMSDLEEEAYGKIMNCFQSVQGEQQQAIEENRKLRKDMCSIIKFVQNAYHRGHWDKEGISLETLSVNQMLGLGTNQTLPESESEKMGECMKSLVNEMAAKHDEVLHLKSQICALDEAVVTATQKLLLKDQAIAQLHQQLKEMNESISNMSEDTPCEGPSANAIKDVKQDQMIKECVSNTITVDTITNDLLENLSMQDSQESEMLRILNEELNDFFELHSKQEYPAMERSRKRLSCFFEKIKSERDDAVEKLESIRSYLRILQTDQDLLSLSTISFETGCGDPDYQVLEALRRRLNTLCQNNRELHGKCQRLDTESKIKISELEAKIELECGYNQKSAEILKEIADLICKMRSTEFSYDEIYDESLTENPFCMALTEILEARSVQVESQMVCNEKLACQIERLQGNLKDRDDQINQLQSMIRTYSDFSENNRLKGEIHELKKRNCDLSRKVREMTGMVNTQEEQRVTLCTKYEGLLESFEGQCEELNGAKKKVQSLQSRLEQLEQLQDELRTERKMLREEVICLKDKEAVSAGRERALNDQLKNSQQDVGRNRLLVRDMQGQLQQSDAEHREKVKKLEATIENYRDQMKCLVIKVQDMQTRLNQQAEVNEQQKQIIESFRKWKEAQLRADEATRQCAKQAEDHIQMLQEENQTLVEDYRTLFRDHSLLETEMRRVKQAVNYVSSSSMGYPPQTTAGRMISEAGNDMARRLQDLTSTSQRISNQNRTLNDQFCGPTTLQRPTRIGNPVANSTMRPTRNPEDLAEE